MTNAEALKIVGALSVVFPRPEWTDERQTMFAQIIADLPYESAAVAAKLWMQQETRQPTPAGIRRMAQQVPVTRALPAPTDAPKWHPGEGIGGNRPPVVVATEHERAKMRAQYSRMSAATNQALDKGRSSRTREAIMSQLGAWMKRWLKGGRACDWCRAPLKTVTDLAPYLEWCMSLGELRPTGTPMPEPKVFCASCAGGAISELVDGIPYQPWPRAVAT